MAVTDTFRNAVSTNDIRAIRIMMKNSLLFDLTFNEFDEMVKAAESVSGLYDDHDGRDLNVNKDDWDDNYMDKLMVQVIGNFSHKRLDLIKDIVRHLYPISEHQCESSQSSHQEKKPRDKQDESEYQKQKRKDRQDDKIISDRTLKTTIGALIGAFVGGAVAAVASSPAIVVGVGVAVGAVAGGTVVAIVTEGE